MGNERCRSLSTPLDQTPEALVQMVGAMAYPAILESGPGFGKAGRWSILAANPIRRIRADDCNWTVAPGRDRIDSRTETGPHAGDPLSIVARELSRWHLEPELGRPFAGGLIGFYGYDLAPRLERLPRRAPSDSAIPDLAFGLYDTFITIDHESRHATLTAIDLLNEGDAAVTRRLETWRHRLSGPPQKPKPSRLIPGVTSNYTRSEYLAAVGRVLEYIRAGDIFQANLSQRFEARGELVPLDLYMRLRETSPAPYSAFLDWGDFAVISASPELFFEIREGHIVTRPIKGTRPRGRTPEDDARLISELQASPKELAELTMIVDLERNDLGRICEYGSVKVTHARAIESFSQVHHLVATVEGQLRQGIGLSEIIRALFPGGSITGAPKIRAMEIIDELEPTRRSLYTGAIGYHGLDGASAFNIAIRTMLAEGDRATYQVGGGIVADSDPESEFDETLHKGSAMWRLLDTLGGGS